MLVLSEKDYPFWMISCGFVTRRIFSYAHFSILIVQILARDRKVRPYSYEPFCKP